MPVFENESEDIFSETMNIHADLADINLQYLSNLFVLQVIAHQWRILRVFSEHPDISKKNFFPTFYNLFYFL